MIAINSENWITINLQLLYINWTFYPRTVNFTPVTWNVVHERKNSVLENLVQRRLQVKRVTAAPHAIYTKVIDRMQPFEACIIEISICI